MNHGVHPFAFCRERSEVHQGRWSKVKEKEKKKEGEEMTLCLYECLKAVGLQCHYNRFTSAGVCRAAHLSGLTMEDYPILGIRSMEDRTRLFHLVQMVKSLDLDGLEYEDFDDEYYNTDGDEKSYAVWDGSIIFDGFEDGDQDVYADEDDKDAAVSELHTASFSKPSCVRRRLDFSCETIDHHEKLFSYPVGTVHVYTNENRNNGPGQANGSAIHVQHELDAGGVVVCSCKGSKNRRLDVHSHKSVHHTGANTKPDIMERIFNNSSYTRSSSKHVSPHKPKSRPVTSASKKFSRKPVGHKDREGISRKEGNSNATSEEMIKPTPVYESKRTNGYNYGLPLSSNPAQVNKKHPGGQRICVCVRKRPLTHKESRRGEADVVMASSGECVIVSESKEAVDLTQYILQHRFYFDQVFGEESSNEEVYQRTAYPLVQHMLNGGKATCFAYGQTGAGKTHTMLGSSPGRPGLYALAVQDIFTHLSTTHTHSHLLVYVSFFEIYCGQLYDLLDHRKRLFAREDGQNVVHIAGLRDVKVDSVSSLLEVISQGAEERTQGVSGVNPLSSRSHALLQIQLRDPHQQIAGRMWFVDLAGSERASDTKEPNRQSRMEGAEINQSLLALKECIRSLDQEQSHTPFRQSKLTQVLKDSFVGDSMTCMIANISPGHSATEHTLNTLRYADRVKELRRQGGLKEGRGGKTIPSPRHNLSKSNSSTRCNNDGTRQRSPPKKPKLRRQREAFGPTTPTSNLVTRDAVLCSTPKNSKWGEQVNMKPRKGLGLQQISPIRGLLETDVKRGRMERTSGSECRRGEIYGGTDSSVHSADNPNTVAELDLAEATDEQLHLLEVQRVSGFYHRGKENQQSTWKGEREGERRWTEPKRQEDSSRDTHSEAERLKEKDLQKAGERDKERERRLRQYHHQLQQFIPSSASSADHLFSPSTSSSFPLSNQTSLSSSVSQSPYSSLQQSSSFSVSALTSLGLEKVLNGDRASVKVGTDGSRGQLSSFPTGDIYLQTEISPGYNNNKDNIAHVDTGGGENWRVFRKGTEPGFGQDRGTSEKRRSLKATGEGEGRVGREDWRLVGKERGAERRRAWMAKTETEQADRMTGARLAVQALVSYTCDSEVGGAGLHASDVQTDRVWNTEEREGADGYTLMSTHTKNEGNSLFNCSPVESPHQRAPAERPLSPGCERASAHLSPNKLSDHSLELKHTGSTSHIPPLPLQNAQQVLPPSRETEPSFAANAKRGDFPKALSATVPPSIPISLNVCKMTAEPLHILSENTAHTQAHNHPEAIGKTSILPPEETSTDSCSSIMDHLSISLLQVDQQVATASFFQGKENNTSVFLFKNDEGVEERKEMKKECLTCGEMAGKVAEDGDVEVQLSVFELSQAKTNCPPTSVCFAPNNHCGIGVRKPLIPELTPLTLQDQDNNQKPQTTSVIEVLKNNAPESPPKPSASTETSVMQSSLYSVQHSGSTGSISIQNLLTSDATQTPADYAHKMHKKLDFSFSLPQSGSVRGQMNTLPMQCQTVNSGHSSDSSISLQSNSHTESDSKEITGYLQSRPTIHLSTLEDLYHSQWRVVQAHWEQLEEMETLCRKEGMLLSQQPDMAFGEYVHKLGEILGRKSKCVNSMIAQLQPYLKTSHSNQQHNKGEDHHDQIT